MSTTDGAGEADGLHSVVSGASGDRAPARFSDRRPGPLWSAILIVLVVGQLVGIIVFGSITAANYPLWSKIDEAAHYEYVQYIAVHGDLPVLGKSYAPLAVLKAGQGFSTKVSGADPKKMGLQGLVYEAFQPPLYYMSAVPIYGLGNTIHSRALWLRFYGLVLYLVAILLFAWLCRLVLRRMWLVGLAAGLTIFFIPGVIVRVVTISDLALTIPLAMAIVIQLYQAWDRNSPARLITAGVLCGLGVLTNLYLFEFIPAWVLVALALLWRTRAACPARAALFALVGAAGAALEVMPWLIFNEIHYRALTASNVAKAEQESIINPHHLHYTYGMLPGQTVSDLLQPVLPQEWGTQLYHDPFMAFLAGLLGVVATLGSVLFVASLGRRLLSTGIWVIAVPWLANLILIYYIDIGQQFEAGAMLPRYMYATLPMLVLAGVAAATRQLRSVAPILITEVAFAFFVLAAVAAAGAPRAHDLSATLPEPAGLRG